MAVGIIGSVGKGAEKITYIDKNITVVAQTQGVDNWQPYSTAGTNCYVYDLPLTSIPDGGVTLDSDFALIPRGTISESMLNNFALINAAEIANIDDVAKLRLYSMTGKPNVDIEVTLRVYNK